MFDSKIKTFSIFSSMQVRGPLVLLEDLQDVYRFLASPQCALLKAKVINVIHDVTQM